MVEYSKNNPFCGFCKCPTCRFGPEVESGLQISHAKTSSGIWICDICYAYDVCVDYQRKSNEPRNPCANKNCKHRPKLVTGWILD